MSKKIFAIVGMAGSGKSEVSKFFKEKGFTALRFGDFTDQGVKELGLSFTEDNERYVREKLRKDLGMAAYAVKVEPKMEELLKKNDTLILDGLYSWEEYKYLIEKFTSLKLIHVYAEPSARYERLSKRTERPVPIEKSRERDIAEIEKTNKGGPIAIADYLVENNTDLDSLNKKLESLLERIL